MNEPLILYHISSDKSSVIVQSNVKFPSMPKYLTIYGRSLVGSHKRAHCTGLDCYSTSFLVKFPHTRRNKVGNSNPIIVINEINHMVCLHLHPAGSLLSACIWCRLTLPRPLLNLPLTLSMYVYCSRIRICAPFPTFT